MVRRRKAPAEQRVTAQRRAAAEWTAAAELQLGASVANACLQARLPPSASAHFKLCIGALCIATQPASHFHLLRACLPALQLRVLRLPADEPLVWQLALLALEADEASVWT